MSEIPKIEYEVAASLTGTFASGSDTVTAISTADVALIIVGQTLRGDSIAAATTVLSKGATSIVMSANATGNATESFETYTPLDFTTYPPIKDDGEQRAPKRRVNRPLAGTPAQVSYSYTSIRRKPKFKFITVAQRALLETFWAVIETGEDFRYYPDKDSATYITYELRATGRFKIKHTVGTLLYQFDIDMERIV